MDLQQQQQQVDDYTIKTLKLFFIFNCVFTLIPLSRAVFYSEPERALFILFLPFTYAFYKLSQSKKTIHLSRIGFTAASSIAFIVMFFSNGLFNSITSLWGLTFALMSYVGLDKRLGTLSFIVTIAVFAFTKIALEFGYLHQLNTIRTSLTTELLHLLSMILIAYQAMSRFSELIQIPVNVINDAFLREHELNRAKDTFLSNMSHELRTPLNGIYGALQIVKGENDAEKSLLKAAKHSAQALNRIVSDILDIQKLSEGKVELAPEWCNSQTFFNNISQLHLSSTALLDIELHVNVHPSVPKKLYCDETRLGQVINNIMGNAIKFTHQGSVTLLVHYHDNTLHLDVTDTGIGMDEAALSHLFDRFTQADASITKKYQGTGLGMAITKELVDLMHGTIELTSTPGEGTTFSVAIPMQGSQQTHSNNADSNIRLAHKDIRILLVDDVDTNTLIGREILRPHFSLVDTASSGSEALVKLDASSYDLLITDIGMPGMSGEELHHAVKAQMPHLPIIALTGNASREDRERYLGMGFDGVTVKPFQLEDLLSLIHGVFETKQSAELG